MGKREINRTISEAIISFFSTAELVMLFEWWSCTECTLFLEDDTTLDRLGKEHAVVILNHNYEIDFLCGWSMAERFGVLGVRT